MNVKNIIMFLVFPLAFVNASAQTRTTPAECYRRCTTLIFEEPEMATEQMREKIQRILDITKDEKDPEKLKALVETQKAEMEKFKASLHKACSRVCKTDE